MPLFGTDGVRGTANRDLGVDLALGIGRAAGSRLPPGSRVLVGRDTRTSGSMLEAAVVAGLVSSGVEAVSLGVAPTPAVAALVPMLGAAAGVVISASHNPPEYNGIKLLGPDGRKWAPEEEVAVEAAMASGTFRVPPPLELSTARAWPEALEQYRNRLVGWFLGRIPPVKAVVDLAHGAATATVVPVLERLGVTCIPLFAEPEGRLINQECGATHPEVVARAVVAYGADVGLSFDGDADRLMMADRQGTILDGDALLYVLARRLHERGDLAGDRVVATVMSNLGLEHALSRLGITLVRTPVGDRWVADAMDASGAVLGGEQSGHLILAPWTVTGDGLLTALAVMSEWHPDALVPEGLQGFTRYPQVLVNVSVPRAGFAWESVPPLVEAVRTAERALGSDGRIVVRPSGTEPVLRIMVEGRDADQIRTWADRLVAVAREALEPATAPTAE